MSTTHPFAPLNAHIRALRNDLDGLQRSLASLGEAGVSHNRDLIYLLDDDAYASPVSAAASRVHGQPRVPLLELLHSVHMADLRDMLERADNDAPNGQGGNRAERLLRTGWGEPVWASVHAVSAPGSTAARRLVLRPVHRYPNLIEALDLDPAAPDVLDSVDEAVLVLGRDRRILAANRAAAALLGLPAEEIRGTTPCSLFSSAYDHGAGDDLVVSGASPAVRLAATRTTSGPRQNLWMIVRHAGGGRLVIVLRRRADPQWSAPQPDDVLAAHVRGAGLALIGTDREGLITTAAGRALADLGIDPHECLGRPAALLPIPGIETAVTRALAGEPTSGTWPVHGIPFDCRCTPTHGPDGAIEGAALVAIDAAERCDHEDAQRRRETASALARLAAAVARDIGGALAVIQCHCDLALAAAGDDGPAAPHLRAVDRAVRAATGIASQLRAAGGRPGSRSEARDLRDLMREAVGKLPPGSRPRLNDAQLPAGVAVKTQPGALIDAVSCLVGWVAETAGRDISVDLELDTYDEDQARWSDLNGPGAYVRITVRGSSQPCPQDGPETAPPFRVAPDAFPDIRLLGVDGLVRGSGGRLSLMHGPAARILLPATTPEAGCSL